MHAHMHTHTYIYKIILQEQEQTYLVATGSLDGLLGATLLTTEAGLCAGGLTPGGLVGRGGTAAVSVDIS